MVKKIKKAVKIFLYPIALVAVLLSALFKIGVKKIQARKMICDPVHEPPNASTNTPVICDPVHEPPGSRVADYLTQKPVIFSSILVALIFPFYLYQKLKQFFTIQFASWQVIKKVMRYSLVWSFFYTLILALVFFLFSKTGLLQYNYVGYPDWEQVLLILLFFIPIFLILDFISGIELLLISIKDKRFLTSGLIFFLIPLLLLFITYPLVFDLLYGYF